MNIGPSARNVGLRFAPIAREIVRHGAIMIAFAALGRATLPDGVAPFAPAAAAAVTIAAWPLSAVIGCILGAASRMNYAALITIGAFLAGSWAFKQMLGKLQKQQALLCLCVGLAISWAITSISTVYDGVMSGLSSVATLLLTLLYTGAFKLLATVKVRKLLTEEEVISLCILAGSMLLGVADIQYMGISLACIAAGAITLMLGASGGAGMGAASALSLGMMLTVGGLSDYMPMLGLAGVTAGGLRNLGKIGAAAGGLLATAVLTFYSRSDMLPMINCALAAAVFLALPSSLFDEISRFVNASQRRESNRREYLNRLREMTALRLQEFEGVFDEMGALFAQPLKKETNHIWEIEALEPLCMDCPAYNRCWSAPDKLREEWEQIVSGDCVPFRLQRCRNLSVMPQLAKTLMQSSYRDQYYEEKFQRCATMAGRQLMGISSIVGSVAEKLHREVRFDDIMESKLMRVLDSTGIHVDDVVAQWAGGRLSVSVERKNCNNQCDSRMLEAVSQACNRNMRLVHKQCAGVCRATFEQARTFEVVSGIAQQAYDVSDVIGDSALCEGLPDGLHLVALSDGMGTGKRAAKESASTIALLKKLYTAGVDRKTIMDAVNRLLLLHSEDEMYSTVDACCIDLISGVAEIYKLGASTTYWVNSEGVTAIRGESLPVGILEDTKPEVFRVELHENDWLIFMSDGVEDALGSRAESAIATYACGEANGVALCLMQLANTYDVQDDMTVIALHIKGGLKL